ncbi:MAG: T9SS type A sorting domain-containing protein, partial [Bacteroidales bacterium]|nr:T9SS type A sorting domain-containing protein [Bacteroidales bacterium]
ELSQKNGVWANWNSWDGSLVDRSPYDLTSMDCGWDACRVPWRVGWDYLWFGSESSKRMMAKTIEMLTARELLEKPGKAGGFSNLDGESYSDLTMGAGGGSSACMGAYACALATDESQQTYLNGFHEKLLTRDESPYYSPTLQVLYLLATSGNAANFYALDDCAPQIVINPVLTSAETDGETIIVSCSKMMTESTTDFSGFSLNVNGQVVADAFTLMMISEKNIYLGLKENSVLANNAVILSYSGDQLESTQGGKLQPALAIPVLNHVFEVGGNTNLSDCETENTLLGGRWYSYSDGSKQSYKVVESGANGTEHSIYFEFTDIKSYAGTGFNILNGESPLDCSGSTGFSFYHKGDACILEAKTVTKRNAGYSYQTYDIEAHEEWTKIELTWEDMADDFITSGYVTEVTGLQWREMTGSGSFYIDEIVLIGRTISPSETDRNQLTTTLISANSLYANATTDKYSQASIDKFATEIQSAANEYLNSLATFDELDSTNTALNAAISAFQSSAYGDKKVLDKAIKAAQLVSSEAIIGTAKGNYPQTAKDELDAAIAEAQNAYDTFGLTTSEISQAVSTLEKAVKKFKAAVIKTAIETVSTFVNVYPNPCMETLNIETNKEIAFVQIMNIGTSKTVFEVFQTTSITVASLEDGMYIMQIVFTDGSVKSTQFIKK